MSEHVDTTDLMDALKDTLGEGKAQDVFEDAVDSADLREKEQYEKDEAIEIANEIAEMDDVSSLVQVCGNTIEARIQTGKL